LVRQEEHSLLDIKNTSTSLEITTVIPDIQIIYGTITDTMDVIRTGRKGRHLNTLEKITFIKLVEITYT
jgi:hypothetical protein